ncbi:MAG: hypothetical protein AAF655_00800 [Bacteroidota bacterium]
MDKLLSIHLGVAIFLFSCTNTHNPPADTNATSGETPTTVLEGKVDTTPYYESSTLAMKANPTATFSENYPLLYQLIESDDSTLTLVADYAGKLTDESSLEGDQDILLLMNERDKAIIPAIDPFIANMNEEYWYDQMDKFDEELTRLGIGMIVGEGMYAGLGPASIMRANLRLKATSGLQLYESFQDRRTISYNGEYPYMNMEPFMAMVQIGYDLHQSEDGESFSSLIEEDYRTALETITDIHMVEDQGNTSLLVGKIHTDFYPYAGDISGINSYLAKHKDFPFQQVVKRIIESPSVMTAKPENLYLLVTDWVPTEEKAKAMIYQYLHSGKDIPHYLPVVKGSGQEEVALVYRFHEDPDAAQKAMDTCQKLNISAEAVMVSLKEGKLYQLGI